MAWSPRRQSIKESDKFSKGILLIISPRFLVIIEEMPVASRLRLKDVTIYGFMREMMCVMP